MKKMFMVVFFSLLIGSPFIFCQSIQKQADGIIINAPGDVNGIKKLKIWAENWGE